MSGRGRSLLLRDLVYIHPQQNRGGLEALALCLEAVPSVGNCSSIGLELEFPTDGTLGIYRISNVALGGLG